MKPVIHNIKRAYSPPQIEKIDLDYEISLVLQSSPPLGPYESVIQSPEYFNNNPFQLPVG